MEIKAQRRNHFKTSSRMTVLRDILFCISAGKKPDSRVVQTRWAFKLIWTFVWHYLFTTHQHFCALSYFPVPPLPHTHLYDVCSNIAQRIIQGMYSLLPWTPHKQFPFISHPIPGASCFTKTDALTHPYKKESKESRFLPDQPRQDSALWWWH